MALAPLEKSTPECAARPRTVHREIANSFARRFEFAFQAGAGLQHQYGGALAGGLFGERTGRLAA